MEQDNSYFQEGKNTYRKQDKQYNSPVGLFNKFLLVCGLVS